MSAETDARARGVERDPPGDDELLGEALALLRRGAPQEGAALLETLATAEPDRLDLQAWLELARSALLRCYRERVGPGGGVPRQRIAPDEVLKFNLPAAAGFLLSTLDGRTSVDELVALTGLDPVEALGALANLLDAGIVELAP